MVVKSMFTCCLDNVVITCKHIADWCGLSFQINSGEKTCVLFSVLWFFMSDSISSSQEEELLGSPTALELEQEISESQAVHQNLLDYSEQAVSLILSEDMDRQSEWSRDQLSILDENLSYYTTCADIVNRIHTGGPAESKKLPKFPPLPKRKLLSLYGEQAKKRKMMTPEDLHQYLKTKEIDVTKTVRKEVFFFSASDITTPNIAVVKLLEGYRQIQRQEATSMCFNLQYGHLLDVTFELYAKEKESGLQQQKWDDWLKQNIGVSSSYSRKLREISRLLRPYMPRFSTVGLPFIEVYSMRKELKAMFSYSEEIRQYWSTQNQPIIHVETQSSQ
ncbi:uncharacterized protein LOC134711741 [Mytilus trossulus]|uniref:uncharacterized protein LOC134711741 n=1 Tax=Mytilus trossulus TaxID=6551 RepID=UPI0030047DAC